MNLDRVKREIGKLVSNEEDKRTNPCRVLSSTIAFNFTILFIW